MAGRISDASVKDVRDRAPIAEIVGARVALRPAGSGRLKGLCPFHDEKTPSFTVSPAQNVYHCFGCGAGGDVIAFVRDAEGLTFVEAVEWLARAAGVELTYEGGSSAAHRETSRRQRLLEANRMAAEFYAEQLRTPEARAGRDFLRARGFDAATAERFGVGYAPAGWDGLLKHLRGRGFSVDDLVEAGLARPGSRGSPIDRFHRRLLWPLRDRTGDVVGFGARRLYDDDPVAAKYLNTPETPLFKKSAILYGADVARRAIALRRQAVVVEGYTDVMACHLAGVETAVATCGTAFGAEHVKLLRLLLLDQDEHRGEVIFTFDGDAAGQAAALRALQHDQSFVAQTFVAVEPEGRDPCELRQAAGDVAVRELVAGRTPLVEFAIRSTLASYDLETAEGRVAALRATAPLVATLKDWALRDEYARRLSGWLGAPSPDPVLAQVRRLAGEAPAAAGAARPPRPRPADAVAVAAEREALKVALQRPALAGPVFDALGREHFTMPVHAELAEVVAAAGGAIAAGEPADWLTRVLELAAERPGGDVVRRLANELAVEPLRYAGEAEDRYVTEVLARVQELHVTRRIAEVKARAQRTRPDTDAETHARLFGELVALEQRVRQLREKAVGSA